MKYCDIGKLYEILVHTPGTLNTCSLINPTNHLYTCTAGIQGLSFIHLYTDLCTVKKVVTSLYLFINH